ncbi:hypothetical protein SAMN02910317_03062 [Ruminococcaceae bacterium FB2012]|nr:hypothetical protein SAMN02910317_03062 [Ruminococcaceae bacterium FB2012]
MKNTARKIAVTLAAVMTMSMAATFSASADDTSDSGFFGQIIHWITEQNKEQTKPKKKRLVQMHEFEVENLVQRDYNMTKNQYYEVLSMVSNTFTWSIDIYQLESNIRYSMEKEARFGSTPTWNEDMIRFMKDYWDELKEAAWDWIETNRNN